MGVLAKAACVVVCLWGLLVGLHGLGVPGIRMIRIPLATGFAPASVQRALDGMTAPPQRPADPAEQGEPATRHFGPVKPFADAGPRDAIDAVRRDLRIDLRTEDRAFRPHGQLVPAWRDRIREAYTPTGAATEIDVFERGSSAKADCIYVHRFVGWEGIYVDGDRALALTREWNACGSSGRVEHEQYGLRHIDGQWRLESWLERNPPPV